jgi:hypothetical protein
MDTNASSRAVSPGIAQQEAPAAASGDVEMIRIGNDCWRTVLAVPSGMVVEPVA